MEQKIKIQVETHSHTVASSHALSTLLELVQRAKELKMAGICITDHGVALPDSPHPYYFRAGRIIPKEIDGIRVFFGAEANIVDYNGQLDLEEQVLRRLDWVIASYHEPCIESGNEEKVTRGWLKVLENPYVDVMGHSGNPNFPYHYCKVISRAKELGKIVEINVNSKKARRGSFENCIEIAKTCKDLRCPIVVSSDAHIALQIGKYDEVLAMLESISFPQELVLNADTQRFFAYMEKRQEKLKMLN